MLDAVHPAILYGSAVAITYFDATVAFDAVFDSQHFALPAQPVPDPDELEAEFIPEHVLDAVFTAAFNDAPARICHFDATGGALQPLLDSRRK